MLVNRNDKYCGHTIQILPKDSFKAVHRDINFNNKRKKYQECNAIFCPLLDLYCICNCVDVEPSISTQAIYHWKVISATPGLLILFSQKITTTLYKHHVVVRLLKPSTSRLLVKQLLQANNKGLNSSALLAISFGIYKWKRSQGCRHVFISNIEARQLWYWNSHLGFAPDLSMGVEMRLQLQAT